MSSGVEAENAIVVGGIHVRTVDRDALRAGVERAFAGLRLPDALRVELLDSRVADDAAASGNSVSP